MHISNLSKKKLETHPIFQPNDRIMFCGDEYVVLENHGDRGTVKILPTGEIIPNFKWIVEDIVSYLVDHKFKKVA